MRSLSLPLRIVMRRTQLLFAVVLRFLSAGFHYPLFDTGDSQRAGVSLYWRAIRALLAWFGLIWSSPALAQSLPILSSPAPAPLFQFAGTAFRLDPSLLEAIATVESAGHPDAISPKGATGLMQLMPDTARRFGVKDPFNPVENVLGAARFLAYLHENAGIEDLPRLLAAYNAGEGAISRYGGLPPYPETHEYVKRVLLTYLLGYGPGTVQDSFADSHWLVRPSTRQRSERQLVQTSKLRWAQTAKPKTEADVFAQLEQIRTGRLLALKNQHGRLEKR